MKETEVSYGVNSDLTNRKIQELDVIKNSQSEIDDEDLTGDDDELESIIFSSESKFLYKNKIF